MTEPNHPLHAYFSATPREVLELYKSLLTRYLMESTIREEHGLETVGPPLILERLEHYLQLSEQETQQLFQEVDNELWEYTWFTFSEEWAWYRAKQDVEKALGHLTEQAPKETTEQLVERRYDQELDHYIQEICMQEKPHTKSRRPLKATRQSKK